MPGVRCTVCDHPLRSEIDTVLIVNKESLRSIARRFKVSHDSLHRHRKKCLPSQQLRAAEQLRDMEANELVAHQIMARRVRIGLLQRTWDDLEQVKTERGAVMRDVPGGSTGLLLRRLRKIGMGKDAEMVEDNELDAVMLRELRKIAEQAARELGQLQAAAPASITNNTVVVFQPGAIQAGSVVAEIDEASQLSSIISRARLAAPEGDLAGVDPADGDVIDLTPQPSSDPSDIDS